MGLNGLLNVNKPSGRSSFSIIAEIRRLTGAKRVGHAGTLDPTATGVLPVCLGQATRVVEYIHSLSKEYVATIQLGVTTDTFDSEGSIIDRKPFEHVRVCEVQDALATFVGETQQVPPAYSSIKVKGRRSYELARSGTQTPLPSRRVTIETIELLKFEGPRAQVRVRCSKGTYIRSLANDLGYVLGCGAYLEGLVRTAYGPWLLADACTLEDIRSAVQTEALLSLLYPLDYPLSNFEREDLSEEDGREAVQGHNLSLGIPGQSQGNLRRAYRDGKFLAMISFEAESGTWHPDKVFDP
jgi:tRNA pseudouridine55 synthase